MVNLKEVIPLSNNDVKNTELQKIRLIFKIFCKQ